MGEYISRPHLMAELTSSDMQTAARGMTGAESYSVFLRMVNDAPAANVAEVVRCRECRRWEEQDWGGARRPGQPIQPRGICKLHQFGALADDYCSLGERRETTHD